MSKPLTLVFALFLTIAHAANAASTLDIEFQTENLSARDAKANVSMVSTNPLCNQVYLNPMVGVAINPRYKEAPARITWMGSDRGVVTAEYEEGGFCKYVLDQVNLTFVRGKTSMHSIAFNVTEGKNFQTGHLEKYEILKNQRVATATCKLKGNGALADCETVLDGVQGVGRGFPATFYLWREYLTGSDRIHDVNVRFVQLP